MTYTDYNQCYKNCYNGICQLTYNHALNKNEYTCSSYQVDYSYLWYLMIIPAVLFVLLLLLCCCSKEEEHVDQKAQSKSKVVPAQTQQNQPTNVVQSQNTKVNKNVTGIAPEGQLVTLPNGQVGIFIPVSQQKKTQVQQVQQPPQFYLPQPIYQQQMNQVVQNPQYQQNVQQPVYPHQMQQQAPVYQQHQIYKMQDTRNEQTVEMPQMPRI
ncbi:Hypothetical_protein [Hexamita inflata]|uniref:Hypothetical_protein n=1 Tax=Hexamita inflata TaxID=28002 RepID=A0AA86UKG7_9EUKA|nr:Hypothetical protein HINF_LOCUS49425 [Hexamita inflata]CAI9961787.1 Hypothetical protein HINF_LOCUS49432 [Hexamita inflata]